MPPLAPVHDALDVPPVQAAASTPVQAVQSLVGEGKAQVSSTLGGLAEAVRDIAVKLDGNGAGPVAKYVHDAADTVLGWSDLVDRKTVDELLDDTRTLVRTSPALAVGLAVAAGFVVSRLVRSR
jgi:hypothetical protein